jgi:hypothetical protein
VALAALCKEQNLGDVRGEGTFSDVYATEPATNGSSGTFAEHKKARGLVLRGRRRARVRRRTAALLRAC